MEVTLGREHAKRNIIIFVIGAFLTVVATLFSNIADVTGIDWFNYFMFGSLIGQVLQIVAIVLLRNVNKKYANALWALILNVLIILVALILTIIAAFVDDPTVLIKVADGFAIASSVMEALIVINFVYGTNMLAEENGKGMPVLTKIIVRSYLAIFLLNVILALLGYIPAIGENAVVASVFNIIVLVLYVIREGAYFFFLVRSLWRVE